MAALWKLPMIYLCENNNFAMGTSSSRHAHNTLIHTRGGKIPGIKVDGQNVFTVRETIKWAGNFVRKNGPLFLELDTYRYHGHSMSDPGITYRTKDDVAAVRKTRDPVQMVGNWLLDLEWATEKELKAEEKDVRKRLEEEAERARNDPFPKHEELYTHIGSTLNHYVRAVEPKDTVVNKF